MRPTALKVCRASLGAATLSAIVTPLITSAGNPVFHIANFFSYFTIWSNLLAALVFLAAALRPPSPTLDVLRGAVTLSMTMVGIVFSLLLTGVESDLLPWVNIVVHYIMPAATLIDWYGNPPRTRVRTRTVLVWLALPLSYAGYTFIRGAIVHYYPYPFLDVRARGASVVAAYVAGLAVFTSALAALIARLGSARAASRIKKGAAL